MKLEQNPLVLFAGGIALGILVHKFVFPAIGFSFATASCSEMCSSGDCQGYNCSGACTAGCDKCGGAAAIGKNCGGGTTSGGNVSGSTWYKAKGSTVKMGNARCNKTKCGQDSGSGSGGNRWETVQSGWFSSGGFEVVAYFTVKKGSMCNGGHIGLKHGGPEHKGDCGGCLKLNGSNCCWWDSGIRDDGTVYMEIERPHPHNSGTKTYGNIGTHLDTGKKIGVRWHISRESGGIRLMQFVDVNGGTNWKPTYNILDKGAFMPTSYYSKIAKTQNIEIRMSDVNCNDVSMSASTRKL